MYHYLNIFNKYKFIFFYFIFFKLNYFLSFHVSLCVMNY